MNPNPITVLAGLDTYSPSHSKFSIILNYPTNRDNAHLSDKKQHNSITWE